MNNTERRHHHFFSKYFVSVVSFEPNPVARSLLELNLILNRIANVDVRTVGLSDTVGKARLSFCLDNLGATRIVGAGNSDGFVDRVVEEVEIDLTTGDDALDSDRPVGLIKIDVEGLEPLVLRGLRDTIATFRPVVILEQLSSDIDPATGRSEASRIMSDHGYRAFEVRRMERSRWKPFNDLLTLICGSVRFDLIPIQRFEKRGVFGSRVSD